MCVSDLRCTTIVLVCLGRFNTSGCCRLSRCLGSLVLFHLLINGLEVQIFKIYARTMFDHVPSEKFKTLKVPLKQYSVILFRGLESSDGLGNSNFHPLADTN